MIEQQGRVVDVRQGWATIEFLRQTACGHCEVAEGCGTGALGKVLGRRANQITLPVTSDLRVDDRVVLGLREDALLRASIWGYAVPLAGAIIGMLIVSGWRQAAQLDAADGWLALAALAGGGVGLLGARWYGSRGSAAVQSNVVILKKSQETSGLIPVKRLTRD